VRLLVIRDLVYQGAPQKPEHLNQPYLAFSASFDGELDPFLRDLAALPESREVFSCCKGYDRRTSSRGCARTRRTTATS
jgi:hypothetical protein